MPRSTYARSASLSAILVFACLAVGCGSIDAAKLLPDKLPADLAVVREHTARYTPPTTGAIVWTPAGQVVDDLSGLVGCWGLHVESVDAGDKSLNVDTWSAIAFTADQRFTMWNLAKFGSAFSGLAVESGTYAVVAPNRIRLTVTLAQSWDPIVQAYDTSDQEPPDADWLMTRIGDQLKMVALESAGDADETANQQDAVVWQSFQCAE